MMSRSSAGASRAFIPIAILVCVTVLPSARSAAASEETLAPQTLASLVSAARLYLDEKNDLLVQPASQTPANPLDAGPMTEPFYRSLESDAGVLRDRRRDIASLQEEYTGADTQVQLEDVVQAEGSVTLGIRERTALSYAKILGDEPPASEYVLNHDITFVRGASGDWAIAADELDQSALLPVTVVAADTAATEAENEEIGPDVYVSNVEAATGNQSSVSDCGESAGCDASDAVAGPTKFPISDTTYVPGLPTGVKGDPVPTVPVSASSNAELEVATAIPSGLDYPDMKAYAEKYWDVYNGDYRRFGNDCTNFTSQALRAGGWKKDYGWYRSSNNWWYNSFNQTYTWAGAENWSHFAPRRTHHLDSIWQMVPTDIMQMDFDKNGVMNHGMMVTYRASGGDNIYITQHTTDYHNRSLRTILYFYPNSWYYSYRT